MEPLNNLATLHVEEERLRCSHLEMTSKDGALQDHIYMIRESMNVLWALSHDHTNKSEDELIMQFLGIRLFNASAPSIKLAHAGYYQQAFSALRDFLETSFLVDYLVSFPDKIKPWKTADGKQLRKEYGPAAIRTALDKRDGFTEQKRKQVYDMISHHATHATPAGFGLVIKENLGEIGPFFRPEMFVAWMQEAVKMICNSGVVFGHHFKDVDAKILATKAQYIAELNAWRKKYLEGK